jgi:hypothetical protein
MVIISSNPIYKADNEDHNRKDMLDLLDWLSPGGFSERYRQLQSICAPGSGKWFLESERFLEWVNGVSSKALMCWGMRTVFSLK